MKSDELEISVRNIRPDEEEPDRLPLRWSTVVRLLRFTNSHRATRNTLLALCCLRAIALPFLAWFIGCLIKGPVSEGNFNSTVKGLILFIVLFLISDVALYWRIRLAHQIGEFILCDMRNQLMAHLLKQPISFFHSRRHGSLISRMISDIEAMRLGIQNNFFITFVSIGQMCCAAIFMLWSNPTLFLVLLGILPCLLLVHRVFRSKILHASRIQQETFSRVTSALAETVQGIRVTQGFARENVNAGIFNRLVRKLAENVIKTASINALYLPLLELNAHGFMAALIAVGGWASISGYNTSLGDIVTFFFLADLFFSPITIIGTQISEATLAMAGAERYFKIIDLKPSWEDKQDSIVCPPLIGRIEFVEVCFEYTLGRPVLENISFSVNPGEVIALVGHTGSGKSTLISLLAKLQLPSSGTIKIDNVDISNFHQNSLRSQFGFVFQQNFLFAGTIADNVRVSRPNATDEEILQAFTALDCLDLITQLPSGINTICSEKGRGLSIGQQQIVSFARAMLTNPRILVLDEATSSVDTLTEARLQVALHHLKKGRTCVIIAHRLSTIRHADCVLVLENGKIIERGTHIELISKAGVYAGLYQDFLSTTSC